jgi:hypothetical protein
MFRKTCFVILTMLVFASRPALAQTASTQGALSPGRPAGVHDAQLAPDSVLFVGIGVAVLGLGLYLASGMYKGPSQSATGTGK